MALTVVIVVCGWAWVDTALSVESKGSYTSGTISSVGTGLAVGQAWLAVSVGILVCSWVAYVGAKCSLQVITSDA